MKQHISTAILALFLLSAGAAMAAGSASISSGSVDFSADGDGVVTVGGPDGFRQELRLEGGHASMGLYDDEGNPLADGGYTWTIQLNGVAPADRSERAIAGETYSGAFTVAGGSFVNPSSIEGGFNKDQVFVDDLIVDGSACFGFDCVNGENFGADTVRLKENNLRIHFDDTSNSASFPSNDWRLVANDSGNGGANYFALEDSTAGRTPFKVENNVPNNALYVDSTGTYGRVGFGTNQPAVDLHVKEGNTPTLRLEQDGSNGFTSQTYDIAANEANFFIRDVTNGSRLFFRAKPGAPEDSIFIAADGDIGLGTDAPVANLDVIGGGGFGTIRLDDGTNSWQLVSDSDGNGNNDGLAFTLTGTGVRELTVQGDGDLAITGTCIQIGANACTTAGGGAGFVCNAGTC